VEDPAPLDYSPKCVEEEFSEVRLLGILGSSPQEEVATWQMRLVPDLATVVALINLRRG
jgi:hypothetical protein